MDSFLKVEPDDSFYGASTPGSSNFSGQDNSSSHNMAAGGNTSSIYNEDNQNRQNDISMSSGLMSRPRGGSTAGQGLSGGAGGGGGGGLYYSSFDVPSSMIDDSELLDLMSPELNAVDSLPVPPAEPNQYLSSAPNVSNMKQSVPAGFGMSQQSAVGTPMSSNNINSPSPFDAGGSLASTLLGGAGYSSKSVPRATPRIRELASSYNTPLDASSYVSGGMPSSIDSLVNIPTPHKSHLQKLSQFSQAGAASLPLPRNIDGVAPGETSAYILEEKRRRRRDAHNAVERKRRDNINSKIDKLAELLPEQYIKIAIEQSTKGNAKDDRRPHKGVILELCLEYIQGLQSVIDEQNVQELELQGTVRSLQMQLGQSPTNFKYTTAEKALSRLGLRAIEETPEEDGEEDGEEEAEEDVREQYQGQYQRQGQEQDQEQEQMDSANSASMSNTPAQFQSLPQQGQMENDSNFDDSQLDFMNQYTRW